METSNSSSQQNSRRLSKKLREHLRKATTLKSEDSLMDDSALNESDGKLLAHQSFLGEPSRAYKTHFF